MSHTFTDTDRSEKRRDKREGHPNQHGENCGHDFIKQGDEINHERNSHLHWIYESHVDKCKVGNYLPPKKADL